MVQIRMIPLLTFIYFGTIFYQLSLYSSSNITLLEYIQSSLLFSILIDRFIGRLIISSIFLLSFRFLLQFYNLGILIYYMIFLKFLEFIPLIIDLINILFIYQQKIRNIDHHHQNSSNRLILTLILAIIRLILSLDVIHRKCDCRWKRKLLVLIDLLLFVLVNISLIRYEDNDVIRFVRAGRKLILGVLIYELNDLYYNDSFWMNHFIRKSTVPTAYVNSRNSLQDKNSMTNMINRIVYIRWIVSSLIICLYLFYTFQSIIINENNRILLSTKQIDSIARTYVFNIVICMILLYIIHWDKLQNQNTLKTDRCSYLNFIFNLRPDAPVAAEKTVRTCVVCYNDKGLDEFTEFNTSTCQHLQRSVCNICLFNHIRQAIQITFTDDIYCPELECNIKFNYETVRTILFLSTTDEKLIERYDRYVLHRQLEQMDEFIWCSNPVCNYGQLNAGGKTNNIVTCHHCHVRTCFIHKIRWHDGLSCEEYDASIDPNSESSRRWIVENSKKCPNCPYQIEKNDGCDHMTCIKCHHEFCWSCLADFQPIRQNGNHRHKSTCKHYAPYNGK